MPAPLLEVRDLKTQFFTPEGVVKAVDGVSCEVDAGETLGIVGESGCGKSVTALSIMRLIPRPGRIVGGSVLFEGRDLVGLTAAEMQEVRGESIAMIFQDPMTSLNPVFRVGWQVGEPLVVHEGKDGAASRAEAAQLLGKVAIPDPHQRTKEFPHHLSACTPPRPLLAT